MIPINWGFLFLFLHMELIAYERCQSESANLLLRSVLEKLCISTKNQETWTKYEVLLFYPNLQNYE